MIYWLSSDFASLYIVVILNLLRINFFDFDLHTKIESINNDMSDILNNKETALVFALYNYTIGLVSLMKLSNCRKRTQ